MPFEAAKAVAATFCWNIRYALTPLFGVEFLSICIPPGSPGYGRMVIDPSIVREATILAERYRMYEGDSANFTKGLSSYVPPMSKLGRCWSKKELRPKLITKTDETDNEYTTDTDPSDSSYPSPQTQMATSDNQWTPANRPRTLRKKTSNKKVPSPQDILRTLSNRNQQEASSDTETETGSSTAGTLSPTERRRPPFGSDKSVHGSDYDNGQNVIGTPSSAGLRKRQTRSRHRSAHQRAGMATKRTLSPLPLTNDARAAYMLMKLHMQDTNFSTCSGTEAITRTIEEEQTRKRRRAST